MPGNIVTPSPDRPSNAFLDAILNGQRPNGGFHRIIYDALMRHRERQAARLAARPPQAARPQALNNLPGIVPGVPVDTPVTGIAPVPPMPGVGGSNLGAAPKPDPLTQPQINPGYRDGLVAPINPVPTPANPAMPANVATALPTDNIAGPEAFGDAFRQRIRNRFGNGA